MKKIMILGASILQLPAIKTAIEMGLHVIAVDKNPKAIGFSYAQTCIPVSTIDIPGVINAAKLHNIDGIMTMASDMPVTTVSAVAKELNIIGIDEITALNSTNKGIMRNCLKLHSVPIPKYYFVNSYIDYITAVRTFNNCIVKSADNSGKRGVFFLENTNDKDKVDYAYTYALENSRCGSVVVEEYMKGPEVSVESISYNGQVHVIAITDKINSGAPRFVELGHSQPSQLPEIIQEQIIKCACSAIVALGIKNGPSHTEIIVTSEGPKIVEVGARLGGDNITSHLVPLSTGVDIVKCSIEIALGLSPKMERILNLGSAIRYFESPLGIIKSIDNVDLAKKIDGVKEIQFTKTIGDAIHELHNSSDRVGYVITQDTSAEKAKTLCTKVLNLIKIETKQMENYS